MEKGFVAFASVHVEAPVDKVWDALVNPAVIKQYFFGTDVESDFKEGSPIIWRGEWEGKAYVEKGVIEKVVPMKTLQYSYFSPSFGLPDSPENYAHITIELKEDMEGVDVDLSQDGNRSEEARDHSQKNWEMVLLKMKELLEEK